MGRSCKIFFYNSPDIIIFVVPREREKEVLYREQIFTGATEKIYTTPLLDQARGRNPIRIRADLLSTIKKTISLLAYQGTRNVQDSVNFLTLLETAVTDRI